MGVRRESRKWAMQILFELELNNQDADTALRRLWKDSKATEGAKVFTEQLVHGAVNHMEEIDAVIRKYADNWDIKRINPTDKNVMRVAMYEMLFCEDIPPIVSINEAVDIAKEFGDVKSGMFVNGILDRARKDLKRSSREAVPRKPLRAPGVGPG
ncbi:MAG: transcription antitermination factor NusB [bacterium]